MKILEIFGENRVQFVEKWKIINIWRRISIGQGKLRNLRAKLCAFGPKTKKILKVFKKSLRFYDQNRYGKLTCFTFFTKYFLDFWLLSESRYRWKITPNFYNNFPISGGGGTFRRSPLPTLLNAIHGRTSISFST